MRIWEGVYGSFAEVPAAGPGFEGGVWLERSRARVDALRAEGPPLRPVGYLDAVVALATPARVLDFGGGLGFGYVPLRASLPERADLRFDVVETAAVCAAGAEVFAGDPAIRFHPALPDLDDVTVVHVGSALQYVDTWRPLLTRLAAYGAATMVFTDLLAGDIEPFVSAQNYYSSRIPVRFLRLGDVVAVLAGAGYTLRARSRYQATMRGASGPLPLAHLPSQHRLEYACNLLFSKTIPA